MIDCMLMTGPAFLCGAEWVSVYDGFGADEALILAMWMCGWFGFGSEMGGLGWEWRG